MKRKFFSTILSFALLGLIGVVCLTGIQKTSAEEEIAKRAQSATYTFDSQSDLESFSATDSASILNGNLQLSPQSCIFVNGTTALFSLFLQDVQGGEIEVGFGGSNSVSLSTSENKISFVMDGQENSISISRSVDYEKYSLFISLNSGEVHQEIVNDEWVVTQTSGKISVGLIGVGDALYRVYEPVAEWVCESFDYGEISVKNLSQNEILIGGMQLAVMDTEYDAPTENYDPSHDEYTYEKKPVQLTPQQIAEKNALKKQKNMAILSCSLGGIGLLSISGGLVVVVLSKKRKGGGK